MHLFLSYGLIKQTLRSQTFLEKNHQTCRSLRILERHYPTNQTSSHSKVPQKIVGNQLLREVIWCQSLQHLRSPFKPFKKWAKRSSGPGFHLHIYPIKWSKMTSKDVILKDAHQKNRYHIPLESNFFWFSKVLPFSKNTSLSAFAPKKPSSKILHLQVKKMICCPPHQIPTKPLASPSNKGQIRMCLTNQCSVPFLEGCLRHRQGPDRTPFLPSLRWMILQP